jgi:hypothetical protein
MKLPNGSTASYLKIDLEVFFGKAPRVLLKLRILQCSSVVYVNLLLRSLLQ